MNRFDLEEALMNLDKVGEDIDTIIYAVGDSPTKYTEDQLLNMLIGIKQLHDTRYEKAWNVFEELVHNKTLLNRNSEDYIDLQEQAYENSQEKINQ